MPSQFKNSFLIKLKSNCPWLRSVTHVVILFFEPKLKNVSILVQLPNKSDEKIKGYIDEM